ncbi:MAG: saccharopine dehydrogenase NADP-binding domain-containing protein [Candidatus Krumholzibacteria bacterium]|nr:saccharopine dehydrogenase NADP-binding domain-containing protein [Candidatus Krumholzibacteria bacterium]
MKVIILGAGLVGGPMARDLAKDEGFEVAVADISSRNMSKLDDAPEIRKVRADLSDGEKVRKLVAGADYVINATPGFMGYSVLKSVIEAGVDIVDIAFFPEDPFDLDALARERGVTAIVDCGVAPGMSNVLVSYAAGKLDKAEKALIYVGGLPIRRTWPWEYKAGFSPIDVVEEYTRPARYVENGRLVIRPALSDPEYLEFPGIGTLQSFNSDGLRSLADTMDIPDMKEKTLRYPGHIEKIAVLRESGFFSTDEIEIDGTMIRPLDFTAKLLFPLWELADDDRDLTVMKVIVEGTKGGTSARYEYDLFDRHDETSGVHSMARTTGYTATVALRMLAAGLYDRKGIIAPEFIGEKTECVEYLLAGLRERGVIYTEKSVVPGPAEV